MLTFPKALSCEKGDHFWCNSWDISRENAIFRQFCLQSTCCQSNPNNLWKIHFTRSFHQMVTPSMPPTLKVPLCTKLINVVTDLPIPHSPNCRNPNFFKRKQQSQENPQEKSSSTSGRGGNGNVVKCVDVGISWTCWMLQEVFIFAILL